MRNFDMAAAWNDSLQLMRAYSALTVTIAAVFFFLPALAFAWFGPPPIAPPQGATVDHIWLTFQQNMVRSGLPRFAVALVTLIGSAAILRLWLSRRDMTVGEALRFAIALFPTMVAIELMTNIAVFGGLLLLLLPGLYLVGRLAVVAPAAADRAIYNPLEAIRASWVLSEKRGWSIFLFVLMVASAVAVVSLIASVVAAALTGDGQGAGRLAGGAIEALVIAANGFVSLAVAAAIYRQLASAYSTGENER